MPTSGRPLLVVGEQPAVDDVGQLPFERAQRLHGALAFRALAVVVDAAGSAQADMGLGGGVQDPCSIDRLAASGATRITSMLPLTQRPWDLTARARCGFHMQEALTLLSMLRCRAGRAA